MKAIFQVWVVTLLIFASGVTGCSQPTSSNLNPSAEAKGIQTEAGAISVILPNTATVQIKPQGSKSGQLRAINPAAKQLTVELNNSPATVKIADVEKVTFKGELRYYSSGKLVIRGENEGSASKPEVLAEIPLKDFKLDPNSSEANVNLMSSAVKENIPGLQAVAKDFLFVVEEMRFDADAGKMTLKVQKINR